MGDSLRALVEIMEVNMTPRYHWCSTNFSTYYVQRLCYLVYMYYLM